MIELPPSCRDRFQPIKLLASGGFGSAILCREEALDRDVVIKVLHAAMPTPDHLERFVAEARITSRLIHPNIVRLLDFGGDLAAPWIVYEHIDGPSLASVLDGAGMEIVEALKVGLHVSRALEVAHRERIYHRDIKPANVMRSPTGDYKLIDFGIASWNSAQGVRTVKGLVFGTPEYMPPEYIRGEEFQDRSDLYSLGVLLFQLISGRLPFDGKSANVILRKHLETPAPPVRGSRPDTPAAVEALVARLLEKDPADRIGSSQEVIDILEDLAERMPGGAARSRDTRRAPTVPSSPPTTVRMMRGDGRAKIVSVLGLSSLALLAAAYWASSRPQLIDPPVAVSSSRVPVAVPLIQNVTKVNNKIDLLAGGRKASLLQVRSDVPGCLHVHEGFPAVSRPRAGPMDLSQAEIASVPRWKHLARSVEEGRSALVHRLVLPWSDPAEERFLRLSTSEDPSFPHITHIADRRMSPAYLIRLLEATKSYEKGYRLEAGDERQVLLVQAPGENDCEPPLVVQRLIEGSLGDALRDEFVSSPIRALAHRLDPGAPRQLLRLAGSFVARWREGARGSVVETWLASLATLSSLEDEKDILALWNEISVGASDLLALPPAIQSFGAMAASSRQLRLEMVKLLQPVLASGGTRGKSKELIKVWQSVLSMLWISRSPDRLELIRPIFSDPEKMDPSLLEHLMHFRDAGLVDLYSPLFERTPEQVSGIVSSSFWSLLGWQRQSRLLEPVLAWPDLAPSIPAGQLFAAAGHVPLSSEARKQLERHLRGPAGAYALLAMARQACSRGEKLDVPTLSRFFEYPTAPAALALGLAGTRDVFQALEKWMLDESLEHGFRGIAAFSWVLARAGSWSEMRTRLREGQGSGPPISLVLQQIDGIVPLLDSFEYRPADPAGPSSGSRDKFPAFILGTLVGGLDGPTGLWAHHEERLERPQLFGWWRSKVDGLYHPASELQYVGVYSASNAILLDYWDRRNVRPVSFRCWEAAGSEVVVDLRTGEETGIEFVVGIMKPPSPDARTAGP